MRDLPGPGLKPVSPALAGGFSTTAPPGKPASLRLSHTVLLQKSITPRMSLVHKDDAANCQQPNFNGDAVNLQQSSRTMLLKFKHVFLSKITVTTEVIF